MNFGQQFSSGDQGALKVKFWRSGMQSCPRCGSGVRTETHCAGCRMNGDGYGTEVYACTSTEGCGWSTSFQYDDASDTYYYETRGWSRATGVDALGVADLVQTLQKAGFPHEASYCERNLRNGAWLASRSEVDVAREFKIEGAELNRFLQWRKSFSID
jgi:hypothetical protein